MLEAASTLVPRLIWCQDSFCGVQSVAAGSDGSFTGFQGTLFQLKLVKLTVSLLSSSLRPQKYSNNSTLRAVTAKQLNTVRQAAESMYVGAAWPLTYCAGNSLQATKSASDENYVCDGEDLNNVRASCGLTPFFLCVRVRWCCAGDCGRSDNKYRTH